ncbi:MAG: SseB family protein [Pseudomonadota bacterium]
MTPLDTAHAAMEAAPDDDTARLAFYDRLAASELFLLLEAEPESDTIRPQIFPVEGQNFVLVFDREERLSDFAEGSAPYASLSGRALAGMLAGQDLGLAVNPDVAPSSILIEAASVGWLADTLSGAPDEVEETAEEVGPPVGLPETLLTALDTRLATAEGLANLAYLVGVTYAGGRRGHLLAFVAPVPGAEPALAQVVADALTFSGVEAGTLDVGFFRASDPMAARLARVGLRFDLPETPAMGTMPGSAPGMDPDAPPRLK